MIVKNHISPLWLAPSDKAMQQVVSIVDAAPNGTGVFFRADDIGVPGDNCRQMMHLFRTHAVPLHMAVTPAWLTKPRWDILKQWGGDGDEFCWHQHGWQHRNHQLSGKKSEFGPDRTADDKRQDLAKGRQRLASIMGQDFRSVFTPPWNRFDSQTADILVELGFTAVSRSVGEQRKVPLTDTLPDIPINVDLHTRNEADPTDSWNALTAEFEAGIQAGCIGVMLHHQRMNVVAIDFLDLCLSRVAHHSGLVRIRFDAR